MTRQVGRGTFVGCGSPPARAEIRTFPAEVFETRLIVEPAIASLAAQRISSQELDELERVLLRGAAPIRLGEFEHRDAIVHKAIVAACRNSLLIAL
ncbi:FadR/GntR family transcriptional regulator [Pseudogemmobacter sonorensis]|uniref:FadR/GntR family transcriptional regulator n=1 Tax=Pseudogemmobacter sonorensis TaxID=2989681 RepID=UPI00368FAEE1